MKNLIRFAVAGALAAGSGLVHAQPAQPSSNASDLWLFVADTATSTTYAVDTGELLSSLLPAADYNNSADLETVTTNFSQTYSGLGAFLSAADTAGQASDLEWAVEGVNYNGSTSAKHYSSAGGIVNFASNNVSTGIGYATSTIGNLSNWANGLESDVQYLDATYTTGGGSYAWAAGTNGGSVWGDTIGAHAPAGSTDEYNGGALPDQSGYTLSNSEELFAATGQGTGLVSSYDLGNVTLSTNGTLTIAPATSTVPLPPAVWLLGSGLLGLAGVGRRRSA